MARWRARLRNIVGLPLTNFLGALSLEMVRSILPVFFVLFLSMRPVSVGFIDGLAGAAGAVMAAFSGPLCDHSRLRRRVVQIRYGFAVLSMQLFYLAPSIGWVLVRSTSGIGQGIHGTSRAALVSPRTLSQPHGACLGRRQSLGSLGAVAGPFLMWMLLLLPPDGDVAFAFWDATVVVFLAWVVAAFGVREPGGMDRTDGVRRLPIRRWDLARLGGAYWSLVVTATLLTLARSSDAFLVLRAFYLELPLPLVPLVMFAMNAAFGASAYPAGWLSDRTNRRLVLGLGMLVLTASHVVLALAGQSSHVFAGAILWGLHLGLTQGPLASLVADLTPAELRDTGFGLYHLIIGAGTLVAATLAGCLWELYGAPTMFLVGAALTVLALGGVLMHARQAQ